MEDTPKITQIFENFECCGALFSHTDFFTASVIMNSLNKSTRKIWKEKQSLFETLFQKNAGKYIRTSGFSEEHLEYLVDKRYKYVELSISVIDEGDANNLLLLLQKVEEPQKLRFRAINFLGDYTSPTYNEISQFFVKNNLSLDPILYCTSDEGMNQDVQQIEYLSWSEESYWEHILKTKWKRVKKMILESQYLIGFSDYQELFISELMIMGQTADLESKFPEISPDSNLGKSVKKILCVMDHSSYAEEQVSTFFEKWKKQFLNLEKTESLSEKFTGCQPLHDYLRFNIDNESLGETPSTLTIGSFTMFYTAQDSIKKVVGKEFIFDLDSLKYKHTHKDFIVFDLKESEEEALKYRISKTEEIPQSPNEMREELSDDIFKQIKENDKLIVIKLESYSEIEAQGITKEHLNNRLHEEIAISYPWDFAYSSFDSEYYEELLELSGKHKNLEILLSITIDTNNYENIAEYNKKMAKIEGQILKIEYLDEFLMDGEEGEGEGDYEGEGEGEKEEDNKENEGEEEKQEDGKEKEDNGEEKEEIIQEKDEEMKEEEPKNPDELIESFWTLKGDKENLPTIYSTLSDEEIAESFETEDFEEFKKRYNVFLKQIFDSLAVNNE